jgi:GH25 family lysozyme M1 (1,4-beta-N-acetylmuramidase)
MATDIGRIIDCSSAQHPKGAPINWGQVKAAGVTTAIIKATQGQHYANPFFHQDVTGAKAAGLDVLAYHYCGFTAADLEAAWFVTVAGPLACIADIETSTDVAWTRQFLDALGQPAGRLLSYGSASTLKDIYGQLPGSAWPAAYGQQFPGWGVMWQFTSTSVIAGIPAMVDESSWHGSEIQYDTLFGVNDPPVPTPDPEEEDMPLIVGQPSVNKEWVVAADLSSKTWLQETTDPTNLTATGLYRSVTLSDETLNSIPTVNAAPPATA